MTFWGTLRDELALARARGARAKTPETPKRMFRRQTTVGEITVSILNESKALVATPHGPTVVRVDTEHLISPNYRYGSPEDWLKHNEAWASLFEQASIQPA